jgi:hypothetical protein
MNRRFRKVPAGMAVAALALAAALSGRADPAPSQAFNSVNPPFTAAGLDAPFPDNYYGADHGGSSLSLTFPFVSPFGYPDHSRGVIVYQCAPFTPRGSEGVYGLDVWLEQLDASGNWNVAAQNGGLPDDAGSPYQPVNTPNPGPSPAYQFQWTFDSPALPAHTLFRVFVYVYLYNQGGGSQGNFYVASSLGTVDTGAANDAPRISWSAPAGATNPAEVTAGQSYLISADAQDDNGNLATVTIWKNSLPFAASGSGDGWSANANSATEDAAGTAVYTAQATDADGLSSPLIAWTVQVDGKSDQPPVSSADATLPLGQLFVPADVGGAGTGAWQFAVVGYTNWNGGTTADAGTQTSGWSPSWLPPAPGPYTFWVVHGGDDAFNPSAPAGPYTLTITAPAPVTPPPAPPAPTAPAAPEPPPTPVPPAAPPAPTNPAPAPSGPAPVPPAPTSIYRIRFDPTGDGARVLTGAPAAGSSDLWTDPAGLAVSPWPAVGNPPPAASGPANIVLPAVPSAGP